MKIAIIGAGAAGCFAAANLPYRKGREVTIYEKTGKALQKVKVSGGGRCNVTHHLFDIPELAGRYPRGKQLLRKTLYQFSPQHTIEWFEQRGVALKAEADGRMFPITDSSQTVIDSLWQELMKNRVEVRYHKSVEAVSAMNPGFTIMFADKTTAYADRILVACGGFQKEESYRWLKALGHSILSPVPSLFTFNLPKHPITGLMGVSVPQANIKIAGTKVEERGPVLITHWGLSGPAVLRASAWGARELAGKAYNFDVLVNWLNDITEDELRQTFHDIRRQQGKMQVVQKNPFQLPRRLWEFLTAQAGVEDEVRWGDLSAGAQNKLIGLLVRHTFHVAGKTTFKEEFVTCGGVTLAEINPRSMESKLVPGLFFAGEVVDVDGITGGFNFQHAWASGYISAQGLGSAGH